MRVLLLATAAAALAVMVFHNPAPAQEEKPPTPPARLTASEKRAVEKFLGLKAREVRNSIKEHNYDYAIRLIDAILLVAPGTKHKSGLQDLRIKASEEKLQQKVVRAYLHCAKSIHAAGDKIEVKLRLKNLTSEKIVFPLGREQSRNFGVIIKETHDCELTGSTRMRRTQVTVKQDSKITLEKNQVWEQTFTIDTSQIKSKAPMMRRYVLQAVLRPVEIETGEERFSRYLATGELELWVMPSKHLRLAENAVVYLKEATSFVRGNPIPGELAIDEHSTAREVLFYCAFFLNEWQKKEATPELIKTLQEAAGDTALAVMAALSYLTGEPHGTSKQDWLDWWKKTQGK